MDTLGKFFCEWLRSHQYSQEDVATFERRWRALNDEDSRFCPVCYLDPSEESREQPLMTLPAAARSRPIMCPHCRTVFQVPEPA